MQIDTFTYNKTRLPVGTGYDRRPAHRKPETVIIHTTNGNLGTTFESEARYLYKSDTVGAHFLVGKSGQIAQILEPAAYRAWHAGVCIIPFTNATSIGIECHHAVGEMWTVKQRAALTELTRSLLKRFNIPTMNVDTHRNVARPGPNIRKIDPSDWTDSSFYAWRQTLMIDQLSSFRVRLDTQIGAVVRANATKNSERMMSVPAGTILHGRIVTGELVTLPGFETSNQWLALDNGGYVWLSLLETIAA